MTKKNNTNSGGPRTDRQVLGREGNMITLGSGQVEVRPLPWAAANQFEDKLIDAITRLDEIQAAGQQIAVGEATAESGIGLLRVLMQDDLLELVTIALQKSADEVLADGTTKAQVLNALGVAIEINYSYLKNLSALANLVR